MDNKIELHLNGAYSLEDLKEAVVTGLSYEFMADKLVQVVRKYSDIDLQGIDGRLATTFDEGRNITFAKLTQWSQNKRNCYLTLLGYVTDIDDVLANAQEIILGELAETVKSELVEFLLQLTKVEISFDSINFNDVKIKDDIINHVVEEISIVDQTETLIQLSMGSLKIEPLDIEKFRNSVIEKKIAKLNKIVTSVRTSLTSDFQNLHNHLITMFGEFHRLSASEILDGEKDSKARKLIKVLAHHKSLLDKMQDKMSSANELKRQLVLNRNKLQENFVGQIDNYDRRINEGNEDKDIIEREKLDLEYVTSSYVNQINTLIAQTNQIDEDISKKFNIIDKLTTTLKTAIPSESEMKRFSNIAYKFQELGVKLEMTKVQMVEKNKEILTGINTATAGFSLLVKEIMTGKELFLKNSLMSAIFNSVNIIYDLVDREDKLKEIDDIKMVTSNLSKYSLISSDFQKGLVEFRKIARDGLSTIAIMMGKEYDGKGLVDIIENINETIKNVQECLQKLNTSNAEQIELLREVLLVYKNEEGTK